MNKIELAALKKKEIIPGFIANMVHSDNITLAFWTAEEGAEVPMHSHPHEQFAIVQEGEFEFEVGGEVVIAKPGKVIYIAPDVEHRGKALTPCKLLDVFHPARETYRG